MREARSSSHVATQLIAHRRHDGRIGKAEEKGDFDDAPDYQRDVPRQDRAENHATADEQSASPITPAPDGNRGIHGKDKQQEQAKATNQTPWIGEADGHRDDLAAP